MVTRKWFNADDDYDKSLQIICLLKDLVENY